MIVIVLSVYFIAAGLIAYCKHLSILARIKINEYNEFLEDYPYKPAQGVVSLSICGRPNVNWFDVRLSTCFIDVDRVFVLPATRRRFNVYSATLYTLSLGGDELTSLFRLYCCFPV